MMAGSQGTLTVVESSASPALTGTPAGLPKTLEWRFGSPPALHLLDQTRLPRVVEYRVCSAAAEVRDAICRLQVRGAPAIGVAGAYGVCLGMYPERHLPLADFRNRLRHVADELVSARPTAVNLAWAIKRVLRASERAKDAESGWQALETEANRIAAEDAETCRRIGEAGADLIRDGMGVLTHCNAGALATAGSGTALAVMYAAHAAGRRFRVFADETRPLWQGARLTAFELSEAGIDVSVLCDNAAASLMAAGRVDLVLVGADRIAGNGDAANKIGTLGVAIMARHFGVPFYVAAPRSTFDISLASGYDIPIEFRSESEISHILGTHLTPEGVSCYNPAFDVTPANLITGIVTEVGLVDPVAEKIRKIFAE